MSSADRGRVGLILQAPKGKTWRQRSSFAAADDSGRPPAASSATTARGGAAPAAAAARIHRSSSSRDGRGDPEDEFDEQLELSDAPVSYTHLTLPTKA